MSCQGERETFFFFFLDRYDTAKSVTSETSGISVEKGRGEEMVWVRATGIACQCAGVWMCGGGPYSCRRGHVASSGVPHISKILLSWSKSVLFPLNSTSPRESSSANTHPADQTSTLLVYRVSWGRETSGVEARVRHCGTPKYTPPPEACAKATI